MNVTRTALRWFEVGFLASLRGLFMAVAFGFAMTVLILYWCAGALGIALDALQRQPQP